MMILLQLVPLAALLVLPALFVKLAARLIRRSALTWTNAFLYSLFIVVVVLAARATSALSGLSPILALLVGVVLSIAVGAWFLSTRAESATGRPLGWAGGAQVSGVTVALMGAAGLALLAAVNVLLSPRP